MPFAPTDPPALTRMLVLRHGQSEWNAQGRWQGRQDPPLSTLGRRQAAACAEQLGQFDGVWASPLQRAADTAWIIAELLGIGPVCTHDGLIERSFGSWEGLTVAEIDARWPGVRDAGQRPADAEPDDVVEQRVVAAVCDIAAHHPLAEVLVIAHAGVLRAISHHVGESPRRTSNLDGFRLDVSGEVITMRDHVTLGSGLDVGELSGGSSE